MAKPIQINIIGNAKSAVDAANATTSALGELGDGAKKALIGVAAIGTGAAVATVAFAKKSVDAFKEVASETKALQRVTGESAEESSRLAFIAKQTGTSMETLGGGLKKLSVFIVKSGDDLKKMGVQTTDAKGKLLPLDSVLANVSEKFASMPNGIEKNALAVKIFGKSGTDLIPILNKGKAGLAELSAQADKFGLTLTQDNLDALNKNIKAHKDFNAALDGVKVQLGAALMPALAAAATFMAETFVPKFVEASSFFRDKFGPLIAGGVEVAQKAISALVGYVRDTAIPWIIEKWEEYRPTFEKVWDAVKTAFQSAKDIATNDLIPALQTLWSTLKDDVLPAAQKVADEFNNNLVPAIGGQQNVLMLVTGAGALVAVKEGVQAIVDVGKAIAASKVFTFFTSLTPTSIALKLAFIALAIAVGWVVTHFEEFKAKVEPIVQWVQENLGPAFTSVVDWIIEKWGEFSNYWKSIWPDVQLAFSNAMAYLSVVAAYWTEKLTEFWRKHGEDIVNYLKGAWEMISAIVGTVIQVIGDNIKFALAVINGDWGKAWDAMKETVVDIWNGIKGYISGAITGMLAIFGTSKTEIATATSNMWDGVKDSFKTALNWIVDKWNNFHIPAVEVLGKQVSPQVDFPNIDRFAKGGIAPGNRSILVGEEGPEVVTLGQTSRVYTARETAEMMNSGGSYRKVDLTVKYEIGNITAVDWDDFERKFQEMQDKNNNDLLNLIDAGAV